MNCKLSSFQAVKMLHLNLHPLWPDTNLIIRCKKKSNSWTRKLLVEFTYAHFTCRHAQLLLIKVTVPALSSCIIDFCNARQKVPHFSYFVYTSNNSKLIPIWFFSSIFRTITSLKFYIHFDSLDNKQRAGIVKWSVVPEETCFRGKTVLVNSLHGFTSQWVIYAEILK